MNGQLISFLVGCLGATIQEAEHWYELRYNLTTDKYDVLLGSLRYWLSLFAMIIVSGLGTYVWLADGPAQPLRQYLVIGAAFPLILKKATSALLQEHTKLGTHEVSSKILSDYMRDYLMIPEEPL